jgi:hypothetical protein
MLFDSTKSSKPRINALAILTLFLLLSNDIQAQTDTPPALANCSFETGNFSSWIVRNGPSGIGTTYNVISPGQGSSSYCGSITITANSPASLQTAAYLARRDLPTMTGWYRLTFWMKTQLTQGTAGPYLSVGNSRVVTPGKAGVPMISGNTNWTLYSFNYHVAIPGTVAIEFEGDKILGTIWLDNLTLESTPEPQANDEAKSNHTSP